ncbi:MAG: hypothetical protein ACFFDQ_10720 [Candidatus Thorarchaeota archaeon]
MNDIFLVKDVDDKKQAMSKTVDDVLQICSSMNIDVVNMTGRITGQVLKTLKYMWRKGRVLIIYPYFISPGLPRKIGFRTFLLRLLSLRRKLIIYTVDLPLEQREIEGIYGTSEEYRIQEKIFKLADYIMVFGKEMEEIIKSKHSLPNASFIYFELLDYCIPGPIEVKSKLPSNQSNLVIAGHLMERIMRSTLESLPQIHNPEIKYHFYGLDGEWIRELRNDMIYHGQTDYYQIVKEVSKYDFGVVLRNLSSEHMKYLSTGSTSRFSLYMAAGIPVLVPSGYSYPANIVKKYGVGVLFDNLEDLPAAIEKGTNSYTHLLSNVKELQKKVRSGFFIRRAMAEINPSAEI